MATKTLFPTAIALALTPAVLLMPAGTADAAMVFDFTASNSNVAPELLTVGSLVDGTPTDSSPTNLENAIAVTGSLTGLTDNTQSFTMDFDMWTTTSVSGNSVTLTTANTAVAANNQGIAPANGLLRGTNSQAVGITFDFTNFAPNTILRLTDFTATASAGTGADAAPLLVVDGVSSTSFSGLTASALSIDINDGDLLYITNGSITAEAIRITTLTFEAVPIPEPSSLALLGLGGLCVLRRRRNA